MASDEIPLELLSAYADGELSSAEAARVARAVASDPVLAARLASLQDLRAAVASLGSDDRIVPRQPRPRRRRPAVAAFAVAAMVAGLALGSTLLPASRNGEDRLLAELIAHHDSSFARQAEAAPIPVWSAPIVPLMAATGLTLVQEQQVGDGIRHAVFLGRNGCRLSLFSLPQHRERTDGELAFELGDGLLRAEWQAGPTGFVLVARSMDQVRFATIASSMRAATRAELENGAEVVAALSGARQPCRA